MSELTPDNFRLSEKTISAATVTWVERPSSATSPVGPFRLGIAVLVDCVELSGDLDEPKVLANRRDVCLPSAVQFGHIDPARN